MYLVRFFCAKIFSHPAFLARSLRISDKREDSVFFNQYLNAKKFLHIQIDFNRKGQVYSFKPDLFA